MPGSHYGCMQLQAGCIQAYAGYSDVNAVAHNGLGHGFCSNQSVAYNKLFSDLVNADEVSFRNFVRMDLAAIEDLLHYIKCDISKNRTRLQQPNSARERLYRKIRIEKYAQNEHVRSRKILQA